MSADALAGYYWICDIIVPAMKADEQLCRRIKNQLVEPLIRYCAFVVGESDTPPSETDARIATQFENFIVAIGSTVRPYTRENGEVY